VPLWWEKQQTLTTETLRTTEGAQRNDTEDEYENAVVFPYNAVLPIRRNS